MYESYNLRYSFNDYVTKQPLCLVYCDEHKYTFVMSQEEIKRMKACGSCVIDCFGNSTYEQILEDEIRLLLNAQKRITKPNTLISKAIFQLGWHLGEAIEGDNAVSYIEDMLKRMYSDIWKSRSSRRY